MLTVYARHLKSCPHTERDYRRCHCPKWVIGTLADGAYLRQSLKTNSWERALDEARRLEQPTDVEEGITIADAISRYIGSKRAENLAKVSVDKHVLLLEKQFLPWATARGYRLLDRLRPEDLGDYKAFRATEDDDSSITARKKHERLKAFFNHAVKHDWMRKNPMRLMKPPKVTTAPTDYFTPEEYSKIVDVTYVYTMKGIDCANRPRKLRALIELMRYSGLAMVDAVTLERGRLGEDNSLMLRRAKTGMPVLGELPPTVAAELRALPNGNPRYFFWSGNGDRNSCVKDWQRSLRRIFTLAALGKRAHPHMLRDTFAVELLLNGVPIDQVSLLLGHSSVKTTEKHYAPFVKARQVQLRAAVRLGWGAAPTVVDKPARRRRPVSATSGAPSVPTIQEMKPATRRVQ